MKQFRLTGNVSVTLCTAICILFFLGGLKAQEVTVSNDPVGGSASVVQDADATSDWEVKSSFELGLRGKDVKGNINKYRSDLNYGAGFRLFDSSLLVTAKESKGKPFDSLLVTGTGWSADPNGFARISVEKLGWYKFDSTVRKITYFNNLDNFAEGEHTRDTRRNMGDFDVTILPQNRRVKFHVGYSYNRNDGPATSTYDYDRDEFPLTTQYLTKSDDFRFGVDLNFLGFDFSFNEGYRRFKDYTSYSIDGPQLGTNPNPNSSIATFSRTIPERGKIFDHRMTVHRSFAKRVDFTGRYIYSDSISRFTMLDLLTGIDRSGNPIILDRSDVSGNASRPNSIGDLGVTVFVTNKFSISNTFSFNSYRISGGNYLYQSVVKTNPSGTPLPIAITNTSAYRYSNYRRYMNTFEGDYAVNRYLTFYLGYRYSNRRVGLNLLDVNLVSSDPTADSEMATNVTNTFIGGFKASPIPKKWMIYFDIDRGQADNVFTRLANYNTTNFRIRNIVKPIDELSINFSYERKDNTNPSRADTTPPTNFSADIKTNIIAGTFDWSPNRNVTVNGGYTYNKVTSIADVIFPSTPPGGIGQGMSIYYLRSNYFNLDGWFQPHRRVSVFASYRISRDNSKGDFYDATTRLIESSYPLSFQSPEARVIFRLTKRLDWNIGYQYYKYDELVRSSQNYSAHLPYTSLRIYLGRGNEDR